MNIETSKKQIEVKKIGKCVVNLWSPKDGLQIYNQVEKFNWAPWLSASPETLSGRAKVFPEGHLIIKDVEGKKVLATLSTNRIHWNGDISSLPSWDSVAGEPTDYSKTYKPDGNTMVLMSMNVHPDYKGAGLAHQLIDLIKEQTKKLGATNLIGSFRPNEFGKFKSKDNNWQVYFEEYCKMTQVDGWPIDGWLRNLMKNGMEPLIVDHEAMSIPVPLLVFKEYKNNYNPGNWKEISPGVWECGEVGQWKIANNEAVYKECNLWGKFSLK